MFKKLYDKIIFRFPIAVIITLLLAVGALGYYATKLEIDASAETLLLDDDKDLKFVREVSKRYHNPNFLLVTFTPNSDLLSKQSIDTIKQISNDFLKVDSITKVTSIVNAPLLQSPIKPIASLVDGVNTIEDGNYDKDLVKKEFLNSELYTNSLVSKDFKTTALVLSLKDDEKYRALLEKRNSLLKLQREGTITSKEKQELDETIIEFKKHRDFARENDSQNIQAIRDIIKKYENSGTIFLGGVNMIANDIIGYVKNDLLIYGSTLIFLLDRKSVV